MKWEMNYGAKVGVMMSARVGKYCFSGLWYLWWGIHPGAVLEESGPGLDFFVGHTTCPFIVYWSLALLAQVASLRLDY